ncbi:hypothetical protein OOZ19_08035 [Saccharopolyspora sp. NFXS83]|nr:hypothetical protein [Saccharopolyspora sp. NFXS83]MCX2730188.1 hypothetical protein [Saccharopolyspora sp. NFXS83]
MGVQGESVGVGVDGERAQLSLSGAGDDRVDVGDVGVADEALSPVEDVVPAVSGGGGVHPEDVAAGTGFRHGDRGERSSACQGRKPHPLLFGGGDPPEHRDGDVAGLRGGADRSGDAGEPVDDEHLGAVVPPRPAVAGGDGRADPAEPGDLSHQVAVDLSRGFELRNSGTDVQVGEFGDRLSEGAVPGQQEVAVDLIVVVVASSVGHQHSVREVTAHGRSRWAARGARASRAPTRGLRVPGRVQRSAGPAGSRGPR